ncbi:winged helix DNA-binding domain-containing protein, partial [Clavulina sp. PMI_390]
FKLPSIHSWPPFFTQQRNPTTLAKQTQFWTRLILNYARDRRLFILHLQDAEQRSGTEWSDIIYNPRIKRILKRKHLEDIMRSMVALGDAAYEPERQTSAILVYWRRPEQWAETIHEWVSQTGQLNTILTFYELVQPEITTELSGLPIPLLRRALAVLVKSGRAQII